MRQLLLFVFSLITSLSWAISNQTPKEDDSYFFQIESLKKNEQWEEIVRLGENAQEKCNQLKDLKKEFEIADQLVSTYYRLGNFEKAKEKANCLLNIGNELGIPELIIDAFYKTSAAIRGQAGDAADVNLQKQLFIEAKNLANAALKLCDEQCHANKGLKAKVLFNAGAAECDDPTGNLSEGVKMYNESIIYFKDLKEEDYRQRTLIRLGKAYLLQGNIKASREIIEEMKVTDMQVRTKMHLFYLDAQVLKEEGNIHRALKRAKEGKEMGIQLHASADVNRFDQLIQLLENIKIDCIQLIAE